MTEREARIAEASRERGDEWRRAMLEGAAAYRAALLRRIRACGESDGNLNLTDREFRRRFGPDFDAEVKRHG